MWFICAWETVRKLQQCLGLEPEQNSGGAFWTATDRGKQHLPAARGSLHSILQLGGLRLLPHAHRVPGGSAVGLCSKPTGVEPSRRQPSHRWRPTAAVCSLGRGQKDCRPARTSCQLGLRVTSGDDIVQSLRLHLPRFKFSLNGFE